ncbi:MAG: hypothetical protein P4L35_18650 [Ignavibacteriaceae bacterium]|nr:hypothetical protein [Ignavibacteriaceae bacterium]
MAPSIGINATTIIQTSLLFFLNLFVSISKKADTHNRMKKTIMSIDLILNIGGMCTRSFSHQLPTYSAKTRHGTY